jgi:aminoglycoside phosphotransferase (APT) family kinase protein
MSEWERELEIDPDDVRRAAGSPDRWRLLGSGWDCDAWLADESVVWRAPRRAIAIEPLRREAAIMPLLAPRLPLPVPVPRLVESPALPALARHDLIRGSELAARSGEWRVGAAIGRFLKALHAPEVTRAVRSLVPVDPMGRADPARRIAVAHQRLDEVAHELDVAPLRAIVDQGSGAPLEPDVITHGDLHPRHLLVDEQGALAGIIDWGDCCLGSRAVDLAIVTALAPAERDAFFHVYGDVAPRLWRHARLIGVHLGAALLASEPESSAGATWRGWLGRLAQEPSAQADGEISTTTG